MTYNNESDEYVSKLFVEDRHVYVKIIWKQDENELFHIEIFDGESTWSGRFSNDFARQFRQHHSVDEDENQYCSNVKKCLTGEDENFTFNFVPDDDELNAARFIWTKKFKGANVIHGKVPVCRNVIPKDSIVDILLKKNKDLKQDMKELQSKTDILNDELEKCKKELEKYVDIKTSLETTLYGKFVQLLNAKKRRIQLLEDNLLNFEEPNAVRSELD